VVAAVFGLVTSAFTVLTGDFSAKVIAKNQPMKFAAFEGLYHGQRGAPLVAIGVVSSTPSDPDNENIKDFVFKIEIPNFLSYMAFSDFNAFIPGIKDLMEGNEEHGIMPAAEKISRGKLAIDALAEYKQAKIAGNMAKQAEAQQILEENFKYFGYGYFGTNPDHLVPNVPLTFYSFHIMVALGFWFLLFFAIVLVLVYKDKIAHARFWLILAIVNIPLAYLASQSGWVTAEMGRQPWVIQDLMPTMTAVSHLDANAVITTFILFAVVFTTLLIAELKIMFKTIKNGPKSEGGN
jgi:cytochrome d ubiquinol oxidase subunit I